MIYLFGDDIGHVLGGWGVLYQRECGGIEG